MTTITRKLVESDYSISDDDLRELCSTKLAAGEVDGNLSEGYFRVLYRRTIDGIQQASIEGRMTALEAAHAGMYPIVLDVVNALPECAPQDSDDAETRQRKTLERNRRTNYARSAKSSIARAIKAGIEIENTDAKDARKTALEKQAKEQAPNDTTPEQRVAARWKSLKSALNELAESDGNGYDEWVRFIYGEIGGMV